MSVLLRVAIPSKSVIVRRVAVTPDNVRDLALGSLAVSHSRFAQYSPLRVLFKVADHMQSIGGGIKHS